jgi:hypothetical protein
VPNASGRGSRTGVVALNERVNLRPDLAATGVAGPAQALPGTTVNFLGGIRELNGDLSATASCIFTVDGVESARSEGLWVAEGDAVNCALAHDFTEPGIYTVQMALEDVAPGDYDLSNNTASMQIEIVQPHLGTVPLQGTLAASEVLERTFRNYRVCQNGGLDCLVVLQDDRYRAAGGSFHGFSNAVMTWPADVTIRQLSGGVVLGQVARTQWGAEGCNDILTVRASISICGTATGTQVSVVDHSGSAIYFTRHTQNGIITYSYLDVQTWGGGLFTLPGADFQVEVSVDAQNGSFVASPSVELVPSIVHTPFDCWGNPGTCFDRVVARTGFAVFGGGGG